MEKAREQKKALDWWFAGNVSNFIAELALIYILIQFSGKAESVKPTEVTENYASAETEPFANYLE